jgi:hypothetical protein
MDEAGGDGRIDINLDLGREAFCLQFQFRHRRGCPVSLPPATSPNRTVCPVRGLRRFAGRHLDRTFALRGFHYRNGICRRLRL